MTVARENAMPRAIPPDTFRHATLRLLKVIREYFIQR